MTVFDERLQISKFTENITNLVPYGQNLYFVTVLSLGNIIWKLDDGWKSYDQIGFASHTADIAKQNCNPDSAYHFSRKKYKAGDLNIVAL